MWSVVGWCSGAQKDQVHYRGWWRHCGQCSRHHSWRQESRGDPVHYNIARGVWLPDPPEAHQEQSKPTCKSADWPLGAIGMGKYPACPGANRTCPKRNHRAWEEGCANGCARAPSLRHRRCADPGASPIQPENQALCFLAGNWLPAVHAARWNHPSRPRASLPFERTGRRVLGHVLDQHFWIVCRQRIHGVIVHHCTHCHFNECFVTSGGAPHLVPLRASAALQVLFDEACVRRTLGQCILSYYRRRHLGQCCFCHEWHVCCSLGGHWPC